MNTAGVPSPASSPGGQDLEAPVSSPQALPLQPVNLSGHDRSRWPSIALAAILALAAGLPYANTLLNSFVYDDSIQVLNNPYLRNFHHLREILTTTVWSYLGGAQGLTNYYRPLMTLQYLTCYQLFGFRASMFHLANVLLHVAVVLLLFAVTALLFQDRSLAFVAAAAFALHPIHTESVDWIAGVTDLQLTFFFLLAFWFFLNAAKPDGKLSIPAEIGMAISFALALMSKEPAATFPVLAMVYEHLFRSDRARTNWMRKLSRYGVLWVLAAGYFLLRVHLFGRFTPAPPSRANLALDDRTVSALALVGQYAWKLLWPVRLCAFYVFPEGWAALFPWMGAGLLALLLSAILFFLFWKRSRVLCFALTWILLTLVPVLDVRWMAANAFAERYLYLPSVGFCWLLAGLGTALWRLASRRGSGWKVALASTAGVLAALAAGRIVTRGPDWHDDVAFCRTTLASSPGAYPILNNLGMDYWKQGNAQMAEQEWLKAEALAPGAAYILDNLGALYVSEKRYDEARAVLNQSLGTVPTDSDALRELGMLYRQLGQREAAEREFKAALALSPYEVRVHNELGEMYFDEGRWAESSAEFHASLDSEPTLRAYFGLGLLYWRLGEQSQAENNFKAAEALDPSDARAHFMLALLYGTTGRVVEARREYDAGLKIDPHNNLGALYVTEAQSAFKKWESQAPKP
ncbi:MAG TPA: tetratricopeptide repeat protein [Terriglobia bacterium]|nr:tetratricopeptide repeat protein [Terriglobia bacterium]